MRVLLRLEQERQDRYPGVPRYGLASAQLDSRKLHFGDLTYLAGSVVPHHRHPDAEETQIMLEGELECWLDGHRFMVKAGDCVVANRGIGHAFFNRSGRTARMITAFSVTPPTTEHIPDPALSDEKPGAGVKFGLWPTSASAATEANKYPVNAPVGALETMCEMLVLPEGGEVRLDAGRDQESGVFCISGITDVHSVESSARIGPGDFVFARSESLRIRTVSDLTKLLTVRSLI